MLKHSLIVAAVATGLTAGIAAAQSQSTQQRSQNAQQQNQNGQQVTAFGKEFAEKAMKGNNSEVKLGHLALDKAGSEDVKAFGRRMIEDHSKANDQLVDIANKYHIDVQREPTEDGQKTYSRLESLSGSRFDREYIAAMIDDHEKDINEYSQALPKLQAPDLRQYAEKTLAIIRVHHDMAEKIGKAQEPMSGTTGGTSHGSPKQ